MQQPLCILLIISIIITFTACTFDSNDKTDDHDTAVTEEPATSEDSDLPKESPNENYDTKGAVSPEFDENGNPTGDYAQYLWNQQQMEEAQKSMAEDAMREMYEDDYMNEPHGLPY